jgi:hypothetical protein
LNCVSIINEVAAARQYLLPRWTGEGDELRENYVTRLIAPRT